MGVLPAFSCYYSANVYTPAKVSVWCPEKPEEGIKLPESGVASGCECHLAAATKTWVLGRSRECSNGHLSVCLHFGILYCGGLL